MGYCSFQKTGSYYVLLDDSGHTVAHVRGLRHLRLFRYAWDAEKALEAVEDLCAHDRDNPTIRKIIARINELKQTKEGL